MFFSRNLMYIKSPGAGVGWGTFLVPFTPYMWLLSIVMTIIGAFLIALTYHVGRTVNETEDLPFTFGTVVFISFAAFSQQGKYAILHIPQFMSVSQIDAK